MSSKGNLVSHSQREPSPYATIDRSLSILEMESADIAGILTRAKIKQYRTYRSISAEEIESVLDPRTLIPSTHI